MTPSWLEAYASFIDSSRTATAEQLTFNRGVSRHAALLKVPLIPAGVFKVNTPLTVEITVANDVSIGTTLDSDISFGVSDGTRFIGFDTCDKAITALTLPAIRWKGFLVHNQTQPKFLPRSVFVYYQAEWTLGCVLYCYTAAYSNRLMISKGLTLEIKSTKKTNQKRLESDSLKSPSRKMMFKTESRKPPCNSFFS